MTNHDFNDGKGPAPAHKHSNGGGWVADTATVAASAFVGPDARVYGGARGQSLVDAMPPGRTNPGGILPPLGD